MATEPAAPNDQQAASNGDWLSLWKPEDPVFWASTGSRIAWRTLLLTTISLVLSFSTWFLLSALAVNLTGIGVKFAEDPKDNDRLLFWLVAMPGLAGGTLRVIHTFMIPLFGTRKVITVSTLLKLIPCVGIAWAVMTPGTPYWIYMVLALLLGMGGGDFSSYMPSTSLFFPKRLQGTALGIQAGIGNFGVSLTQFVTPWIIGLAAFAAVTGGPQVLKTPTGEQSVWLQNAALWYVPLLIIIGAVCWMQLRSVPIKASFREQLDIFKDKHTWFCTITYVMTFGSFSGFCGSVSDVDQEPLWRLWPRLTEAAGLCVSGTADWLHCTRAVWICGGQDWWRDSDSTGWYRHDWNLRRHGSDRCAGTDFSGDVSTLCLADAGDVLLHGCRQCIYVPSVPADLRAQPATGCSGSGLDRGRGGLWSVPVFCGDW
jgi:MFS family permease